MTENMTDNSPQNKTNALLKSATQAARNGDMAVAIPLLKQLIETKPDHEIALGMLASIYLQMGMNGEANDLFELLLDKHPENPLARFQYGLTKLNSGLAEEAIKLWNPLLADESNFMAHFHTALAFLQLNNKQDAAHHLQTSTIAMPRSHPLYPQLLELLTSLSKEDA